MKNQNTILTTIVRFTVSVGEKSAFVMAEVCMDKYFDQRGKSTSCMTKPSAVTDLIIVKVHNGLRGTGQCKQ